MLVLIEQLREVVRPEARQRGHEPSASRLNSAFILSSIKRTWLRTTSEIGSKGVLCLEFKLGMSVLDTTSLEQLGVELMTFLHYLGVPRIASISHHLVRQEVRDVLVGGAG